ncbi:hypothetical protein YC2023_045384 [Brassica napus]
MNLKRNSQACDLETISELESLAEHESLASNQKLLDSKPLKPISTNSRHQLLNLRFSSQPLDEHTDLNTTLHRCCCQQNTPLNTTRLRRLSINQKHTCFLPESTLIQPAFCLANSTLKPELEPLLKLQQITPQSSTLLYFLLQLLSHQFRAHDVISPAAPDLQHSQQCVNSTKTFGTCIVNLLTAEPKTLLGSLTLPLVFFTLRLHTCSISQVFFIEKISTFFDATRQLITSQVVVSEINFENMFLLQPSLRLQISCKILEMSLFMLPSHASLYLLEVIHFLRKLQQELVSQSSYEKITMITSVYFISRHSQNLQLFMFQQPYLLLTSEPAHILIYAKNSD